MGKVAHDSETPAHGQQVISACAFIYDTSSGEVRVFLPKRAATKKFLPDVYELPGGHIDYGEDIETGLHREIMEEFGVRIRLGDPFAAFTYTNDIKGSHSIEVIYFAQLIDDAENITLNPEDHSTSTWAAKADIAELYSQGMKSLDDIEVQKVLRGFEILASGFEPQFH